MTNRRLRTHLLLSLSLLIAISGGALAQDPFGTGSTPATPAPGTPGPAPPAAPGEFPGLDDPVVRTFYESNPTTADDLMVAIKAMMDYDREDAAKIYVQRLLTSGLDRDALAAVKKKFGSAVLIQMSQSPDMQPEGAQLAKAVFDAEQAAAEDVTRLNDLVKQLSNPSLGIRSSALSELRIARAGALPPMFKALADDARAAEHPYIRAALSRLELDDAQPLIGALGSPDAGLRIQVMGVLGRLRAKEAVPYLIQPSINPPGGAAEAAAARDALMRILGTTPSASEAQAYLRKQTMEYLGGMQPTHVAYDDTAILWHWDADKQTSVPQRYRADDAPRIAAARMAEALYRLDPSNTENLRLFLTCALEAAKMAGGLDRPLIHGPGTAYAAAASAGPAAVEDVLVWAMKDNRLGAALGAVEVLGDIGTAAFVDSNDGYPRPLGSALSHADRRLRVAAALAIAKLDPQHDYPGASRLPEALAFVAGTSAVPKVLVAEPRAERAQTVAGLATELGFEGETAFTGRQAIKQALIEPDYAFILISDAVDNCDANELYQMLRKDPRTARLPVGMMAREENLFRWQTSLEDDRFALAFPMPHDASGMAFFTRRLLERAGRMALDEKERYAQASQALDALITFAEKPAVYGFYDLARHEPQIERSLFTPGLTEKSARLLGVIGTPRAQRSLVNRASQNATDLAGRQAAAAAFAAAVAQRGTLLTTSEIEQQYDRYNQSRHLDADSQAVLGSILDAIEKRARDVKPAFPSIPNQSDN